MKRVLLAAVPLLAAAAFMVAGAGASGGPVEEQHGFGCTLLDGDGNFVFTTDSHFFIYGSGKAVLQCEASGVANSSGQVVNWNFGNTGITCGMLSAGSTEVWRNRVGAGGEAQLTCQTYVKAERVDPPAGLG
jgi:hypothetical protein